MEKNNLSGILIGLCLGIIMLFGIGLWKMNNLMQKNEKENQSLRAALADKMDQISDLTADKAVLTEDLQAFASNTEEAISKIEKERQLNEELEMETPDVPLDVDGSAQSWISELQNELAELSRQESELLDVLADEQESLDPLSDELEQLEEKYSSILKTESASKELKTTVDSLESKIAVLEKEKKELQTEIDGIKGKSKKISSENSRLKKEISSLEQSLKSSGKEEKLSRKAKKQLERLEGELKEYQETVVKLEGDISNKDMKLKQINSDKDELTKQIISLQSELVKARKADSDNARVKLMQDKIDELEEDKYELQYSLKALQEKFDNMSSELSSVVSGREELASESLKMQERLAAIEDEKDKKADTISKLEKELKEIKKTDQSHSSMEKALDEEREKYEKVNALYSRLKEQLKEVAIILAKRDELITKRESQLQGLIKEKEYLSKKVNYLEDFFEKFKKQQTATYEKLNGMSDDIDDASREVDVVVTSSLLEE